MKIQAIGFDLGNTLIEYLGVPLNWQALYHEALDRINRKFELNISDEEIYKTEEILLRYNTRKYPREKEYTDKEIFSDVLKRWQIKDDKALDNAISIFFDCFQQKYSIFNDTIEILEYLKKRNIKVGILTDAPYGMRKKRVEMDISKFKHLVDSLITSVDVGYRKPNTIGYKMLAESLKTETKAIIFVGDEEKDIIGAKNAGMHSVFINRNKSENVFASDYKINTLIELIEIIEKSSN